MENIIKYGTKTELNIGIKIIEIIIFLVVYYSDKKLST